ncbi:MAG: glycosyltransferase [Candidatus Omnitrophica bacterium]|nr:glycosyltransferase [Candidatus Omnitrophota bacterium]
MVSVVITTKNEEKHIETCLKSIKAQSFAAEEIEIIVVDNGSTDATKEISRRFTDNVFDFGPERSAQRNFGIGKARGKYVLYLDADMIVSQGVIKECVKKCEKDNCVALYIPEKIIGEGFWIKVRNFERSFYNATVIDCVRFLKREAFLKCGGFDENLTGPEDWDFDRRISALGKTAIITDVICHDEGNFGLKKYLRKKQYYSKTFEKYAEKWGKEDKVIKKQLGFWYRYFGVFIENNKWKTLLLHPVLMSGMYFLRILVGLNYLRLKRG